MKTLQTKEQIKSFDGRVLKYIKHQQAKGEVFVTAGEIARKIRCDSVQALGAIERLVKAKLV